MSNTYNARQGIRNIPEICLRHGLSNVVICPGSRNAPLILSFTKHQKIDCISITDERSAGYFALGMSQLNGNPVAVVCTSGTAVLNIAPSVAEAFYQNLPLIIFTADRPKEWIDQADGQTIRQTDVFRNYVKQSFELPLETAHPDDLWHFNRTISQAIDTAVKFPAGPVHINVPLREPLYTPLPHSFEIGNIIDSEIISKGLSEAVAEKYTAKWNRHEKKMIIFGILRKDDNLNNLVAELAKRSDTIVIAENLSNISGENIIFSPEPLFASLTDEEKADYKPDLIITVGEGIVSKRLKQYLRAFAPAEQWHLSTTNNYTDTYKSLSTIINVDPFSFLVILNKEKPISETSIFVDLKAKNHNLITKHKTFLSKVDLIDIRIMHEILSFIPEKAVVHLANSTPIRYSQLSPSRPDLTYFCNRGTSGIDGCISTATGSAYMSQKSTYIISGDLAFIYDSNALWNNLSDLNLKIIVINNNGGNIFSLIESSPEMDNARSYFETPHKVKIKALAEAYNVNYLECTSISTLKGKMEDLAHFGGISILEIKTDANQNTKFFKEYYQYIKKA